MGSGPLCRRFVTSLICFFLFSSLGFAQQVYVRPMVNAPVDEGQWIRLKANPPLARPSSMLSQLPRTCRWTGCCWCLGAVRNSTLLC